MLPIDGPKLAVSPFPAFAQSKVNQSLAVAS